MSTKRELPDVPRENGSCTHPGKLVMFDFDGVLADSLAFFHESLTAVGQAYGFPWVADRNAFLDLFEGNMVSELRERGLTTTAVPSLLQDLGARLAAEMDRYPPFPGVRDALRFLTRAAPVYIISSNLTAVVREYTTRYALDGIREIFGSDIEGSKQVKIRRLAAQWPALQPVYVGDTAGDIVEARAAGAIAVGAAWGWHGRRRLGRAAPDLVLSQPSDLTDLLRETFSNAARQPVGLNRNIDPTPTAC